MKQKILCTSILLAHALLVTNSHASLSKKERAFIEKHQLPQGSMKECLDTTFAQTTNVHEALKKEHFSFLKDDKRQIVAFHQSNPCYLVKAIPPHSNKLNPFFDNINIRRIEIAEKIKKLIRNKPLFYITVAEKYLYHIPQMPDDLNDRNYLVISQKLDLVDLDKNKEIIENLPREYVEEIYTVIEHTGLLDSRTENVRFTLQGKVAFIDTEPRWQFSNIPLISSWLKKHLGKRGAKRFNHDVHRFFPLSQKPFDFDDEGMTEELSTITRGSLSPKQDDFIARNSLTDTYMNKLLDEAFSTSTNAAIALKKGGFSFIKAGEKIVAFHPDAPRFLVKATPPGSKKIKWFIPDMNIRRIEIAQKIRTLIEYHNLSYITVAQKYLYHIPGTSKELIDTNYIVVVERLNLVDEKTNKEMLPNLPGEYIEEIYFIIQKTGLVDIGTHNIILTKRGKVAFIDTEPRRQLANIPIISRWIKKNLGKKGAKRFHYHTNRSLPIDQNNQNRPITADSSSN